MKTEEPNYASVTPIQDKPNQLQTSANLDHTTPTDPGYKDTPIPEPTSPSLEDRGEDISVHASTTTDRTAWLNDFIQE